MLIFQITFSEIIFYLTGSLCGYEINFTRPEHCACLQKLYLHLLDLISIVTFRYLYVALCFIYYSLILTQLLWRLNFPLWVSLKYLTLLHEANVKCRNTDIGRHSETWNDSRNLLFKYPRHDLKWNIINSADKRSLTNPFHISAQLQNWKFPLWFVCKRKNNCLCINNVNEYQNRCV